MKKLTSTFLITIILLANICTVNTVSASADHYKNSAESECNHCNSFGKTSNHDNVSAFIAQVANKDKAVKLLKEIPTVFPSVDRHILLLNRYHRFTVNRHYKTSISQLDTTVKRE